MRDRVFGAGGSDGRSLARRALTVVLTVALLIAVLGTVYVAVTPSSVGTPYTELYVLNQQGVAADYPTNLTVGESGTVVAGVANHEQEQVQYLLVVSARNETIERQTFALADGESWDGSVTYSFDEPGSARVRFQLYRGTTEQPDGPLYREARLLVSVTDGEGSG